MSEVVASSWGLNVTKIRCPVCRTYIPQTEWSKFVPASTVELYNKFNRPYRSFSRCCSHCQTEVMPCDFKRLDENRLNTLQHHCLFMFYANVCNMISESKAISSMIKDFFCTAGRHASTLEHRLLMPNFSRQQYWYRMFDRSEWRNSTLPDIHYQLIQVLSRTSPIVDQTLVLKAISKKILQLEVRSDTWRKLQFDHISFFPSIDWYIINIYFILIDLLSVLSIVRHVASPFVYNAEKSLIKACHVKRICIILYRCMKKMMITCKRSNGKLKIVVNVLVVVS